MRATAPVHPSKTIVKVAVVGDILVLFLETVLSPFGLGNHLLIPLPMQLL